MIGEDDLEAMFDPDEFGLRLVLIVDGQAPREILGMQNPRDRSGPLYRSGIDPNAANLRVRPDQVKVQVSARDVPELYRAQRLEIDGVAWSIANVEPLGRIRSLMTLVPYGARESKPERGKWQATN
ncbi:TPA: hypothetical protein ACQTXQ_005746 [Pseudomonas aeruginosa]